MNYKKGTDLNASKNVKNVQIKKYSSNMYFFVIEKCVINWIIYIYTQWNLGKNIQIIENLSYRKN